MTHYTKNGPSALYRVWDASGQLLYVGASPSPLSRLSSHCTLKSWRFRIASVTVEWFPTRKEAIAAEASAIRSEHPEWNVQLRANPKHAPGIFRLSAEDYQRDDLGLHLVPKPGKASA